MNSVRNIMTVLLFISIIIFLGGCGLEQNGGIVDNGRRPKGQPADGTSQTSIEPEPKQTPGDTEAVGAVYVEILGGKFEVAVPKEMTQISTDDNDRAEFVLDETFIRFAITKDACDGTMHMETSNGFRAYPCGMNSMILVAVDQPSVIVAFNIDSETIDSVLQSFRVAN